MIIIIIMVVVGAAVAGVSVEVLVVGAGAFGVRALTGGVMPGVAGPPKTGAADGGKIED
jgi:hypothetical protein